MNPDKPKYEIPPCPPDFPEHAWNHIMGQLVAEGKDPKTALFAKMKQNPETGQMEPMGFMNYKGELVESPGSDPSIAKFFEQSGDTDCKICTMLNHEKLRRAKIADLSGTILLDGAVDPMLHTVRKMIGNILKETPGNPCGESRLAQIEKAIDLLSDPDADPDLKKMIRPLRLMRKFALGLKSWNDANPGLIWNDEPDGEHGEDEEEGGGDDE